MSALFFGSIIGFCMKNWISHKLSEKKETDIVMQNMIIGNKRAIDDIYDNYDDELDDSIHDKLDDSIHDKLSIKEDCMNLSSDEEQKPMLTNIIKVITNHMYANVYMMEFRNSNDVSSISIVFDTFGDILSCVHNETEFPTIPYKEFGHYILLTLADFIYKSKHYQVLSFIVVNELHDNRNPLRKIFTTKYEKKYNNIQKHIKKISHLYKNHLYDLSFIRKMIKKENENAMITFPYNVNNILSQFILSNGTLKNIGPIPYVVTSVIMYAMSD